MSLPIGTALRDGFFKVASRAGAILIGAYLAVNLVNLVAMNSAMKAYFTQNAIETTGTFSPAVNLPLAAGGALTVLSTLLIMYVMMIAMRTFVADERDSFRNVDLTGGIALAFLNLVIGGIVQGIAVAIGLVALVIPGVFLAVSFVFMQLFIVVENDDFVTAMRRSWRLTDGSRISLFLLGFTVVVLGTAIGFVFGIGSVIAMFAGLDQAIVNAVQIVVIAPLSLYGTAVLASAFNLLRGESDERSGGTTAADTPSTPA